MIPKTGGPQYSDTSPFSIVWLSHPGNITNKQTFKLIKPCTAPM